MVKVKGYFNNKPPKPLAVKTACYDRLIFIGDILYNLLLRQRTIIISY